MGSILINKRPGSLDIKPASQTKPVRINNFIYLSEGASNSYLIETTDGNILINTGLGVEAPVHKYAFDQVNKNKIKYIIFTQGHVDHVGGSGFFKEYNPDATLIAQENIIEHQSFDSLTQGGRVLNAYKFFGEMIDLMNDAIARAEKMGFKDIQSIAEPDILFKDEYKFSLGGLDVELYSVPGGETLDALLIYLPKHKILFSGNAFGPLFPHLPNFCTIRGDRIRFAIPYLEMCKKVLELKPNILITGHFKPIEGQKLIYDEVKNLHDAVDYIHTKTVEGINTGKDMYELMKEIVLPKKLSVGEGYGTVEWAIRSIYEGYTGWFRHKSTTELYAYSPQAIFSDLNNLIDKKEALKRIEEFIAGSEYLKAINLCEIVISSDDNKEALKIYLDIHIILLKEAQKNSNRWIVKWLESEIEETKNKLNA
ncbi:MAG: MBL fold metallo-hydrolase [Pseudomonadota bacterium]|nr:MBL fold metallo-hydrolase [Pseudomonadota bacterium]|tara:strand:- start:1054 stop:2328 length:1275 start_codon:yes stop_codon:yes gene_type:complete